MPRSPSLATILLLTLLSSGALHAQGRSADGQAAPRSIAERTASMQKLDGYFPLYWEEPTGALFIEIPRFDEESLLSTGLAAGLGSNYIGLDRGIGGAGRVVKFERV